MRTAFRLRETATLVGLLLLGGLIAFGCGPTDDSDSSETKSTFNCCVLGKICKNCDCQADEPTLVKNDNDQACKAFLDEQDNYGCDSSKLTSMPYRETNAIVECSK